MALQSLKKATQPGTLAGLTQPDIEKALQPYRLAIANALPTQDSPDRIIQIAAFKIATTPELAVCTAKSIVGCVLNASTLALNPALGHCHFVPRKNGKTNEMEASFQIDYKGMIDMARRSGRVAEISAEVVRDTDHFRVQYGTNRGIEHIPDLDNESDNFTYVYAVIKYIDGGTEFIVLTPAQVAKRRAVGGAKNPKYDFWEKWRAEMWKKTALHALLKMAPLTERQAAWMNTDGAVLSPNNFKRGMIQEETIVIDPDTGNQVEEEESAEVAEIREQIQDLGLDDLERYWNQGKRNGSRMLQSLNCSTTENLNFKSSSHDHEKSTARHFPHHQQGHWRQ